MTWLRVQVTLLTGIPGTITWHPVWASDDPTRFLGFLSWVIIMHVLFSEVLAPLIDTHMVRSLAVPAFALPRH